MGLGPLVDQEMSLIPMTRALVRTARTRQIEVEIRRRPLRAWGSWASPLHLWVMRGEVCRLL